MDVRILGSAEVRHDGSPLTIRGAKPRQLLVLLAMRANRPVPTDQLVEELWEGGPPPSAATALRVHIGRLRHVFEPERSPSAPSVRLPAGPHGYLLRLEPDELDTERFERQVLLARQSNAAGAPSRAIPHLTEALDLWRGPALADARDLSAMRADMARLDELRGIAFEELATARLAIGEHALVVDVLLAATEIFPLREKLTASLMIALYRSNRAAEALRAFAQLAQRLDDQLGVVPSQSLRTLEEDILLQRSTLDLEAPSAAGKARIRQHPPRIQMIGRHKEFRDLVSFLQDSASNRQRLFLVVGSAGIGKTTLITEVRDRMEQENARVFIGTCTPDPAEPYEPVGQVLRQMAGSQSANGVVAVAGSSPLEDALSSLRLEGGGVGARFRLNESVTASLERFCAPGTVLIFEDLHWADRPTLLLLRHLVRHPALTDVSFVATFRDDDISGERLELVLSVAPPSLSRIERLPPFHDGEVHSFVQAVAPPESVQLLAGHASDLRKVTEGNPFFLRELLRELDEESVKLRNSGDLFSALSTIVPEGVRALITRRTERLTRRSTNVLFAAAVLGDSMSTAILGEVSELQNDMVLDAVEECLATRLLVEDSQDPDRFLFPHAMVRNTVYANIPHLRRAELHRRVACALVRHFDSTVKAATIAHHYCEAAPLSKPSEVATYTRMAAIEAERHLMFSEAAAWYERAIDSSLTIGESNAFLGRLYLALGRAYANDRQTDCARRAFLDAADAARRSGDSALLLDVALAVDGPWSSASELRALALVLLQEAIEDLDVSDNERRVRALSGIAAALYYVDHEREGQAAREAHELSPSCEDLTVKAVAILALHRWTTHQPAAREERLALCRSACDLVASSSSRGDLFLTLQRELLADLLENRRIDEFNVTLVDYERNARDLGSPADIYWSMALRATEATLHGDLALAEQLARGAALRGYEFEQFSEGALVLQRFLIRYQQARLSEELPVLHEAAKASSVFRAGAALLATVLSESGRHEKAREVAWRTLGDDGSELPRDVYWLAGVALFSGVAALGQDRELQTLLTDLLNPCADHVVVFGVGGAILGSSHYWLGLLAASLDQIDDAIEHLHKASAVADEIDGPFWKAESQIALSQLLATRGLHTDKQESARLAQASVATAQRLGFGRILRQASNSSRPAPQGRTSSRARRRSSHASPSHEA